MADGVLRASLQILKGNLNYQSLPSAFNFSLTNAQGPTPGNLLIALAPGTDVDLSKLLALGGYCFMINLDTVNFVTYGIHDASNNTFYPLGELGPGEPYVIKLSRNLLKDQVGTAPFASITTFRMIADTSPCYVRVEAFAP